jgi:hypothetical protein
MESPHTAGHRINIDARPSAIVKEIRVRESSGRMRTNINVEAR